MVNILPPRVSIADQLGMSLGQGLQQGLQQAAQTQYQRNLISDALSQAEKEIYAPPKQKVDNEGKPLFDTQKRPIYEEPTQKDYLRKVFAIMKATAGIPGSERYLGQLFEILSRQQAGEAMKNLDVRNKSDQPQPLTDEPQPLTNEPQPTKIEAPKTREELLQRFATGAPQAGLEKAFEEKQKPSSLPKLSFAPNETGFFRRALTKQEQEDYFATRRMQGATDDTIQNELNIKNASNTLDLEKALTSRGLSNEDIDNFINLANTNFPNIKSAEEAYRKTLPLFTQLKNHFGQIDELYKPSTAQSVGELIVNKGKDLVSFLALPAGIAGKYFYDLLKSDKKEEKGPNLKKVLTGETSYQNLINVLRTIAAPTIGTPYEPQMRQKITSFLNGVRPGEEAPDITTTSWDIESVFNNLSKKAQAKLLIHVPKNLKNMTDDEQIQAVSNYLTKYANPDDSLVLIRQNFLDKGVQWENFFEGFNLAQNQKKPYVMGPKNVGNIATISNPPRDTLTGIYQTGKISPIVRGQK